MVLIVCGEPFVQCLHDCVLCQLQVRFVWVGHELQLCTNALTLQGLWGSSENPSHTSGSPANGQSAHVPHRKLEGLDSQSALVSHPHRPYMQPALVFTHSVCGFGPY